MKRRNRWGVAFGLTSVMALSAVLQPVHGQSRERVGRLVSSYRAADGAAPAWVAQAEQASRSFLKAKGSDLGVADATAELSLLGVDSDDLSTTHVRLNQVINGIPVFGGQLVAHLDGAGSVTDINGEFYAAARSVNLKPAISAADAVAAANKAFGSEQVNGQKGNAQLVVLPTGSGAILAYHVPIYIEDGSDATAHHEYFVNAADGTIAFYYNSLDTENKAGKPMVPTAATGTGASLYSGSVSIGTDYTSGAYYLRDLGRGSMETWDMRSTTTSAYYFTDADNSWGNGSTSSSQSAAVSAHFASAKTWDYYLNVFGRRGIDGNGFKVINRVHYGSRYNNAFWDGTYMSYGDGDGSTFAPLVSLDVGGHEITHGLTEKTAGLVYSNESGALNEAMSDIFGTAIEFYTGTVGGRAADYNIGEDIYTPATSGDALRSMSNPGLYGDPDNYSIRYTGTADNGGVHTNSGIVNQAFYLLAAGGTNRTSGRAVTGIGQRNAEKIFYRALTVYMTPSTNFSAARAATLRAATDLFGTGSTQYNATAAAWTAVGVN